MLAEGVLVIDRTLGEVRLELELFAQLFACPDLCCLAFLSLPDTVGLGKLFIYLLAVHV